MAAVPAGFTSQWRTVQGLRLHALQSAGGLGSPVVMLPGLVTASRSMVPLARALASHGMRACLLDLPGFGYSDKPRHALSLDGHAALAGEWLAAEGHRPAMLLGNSFGTQVAAALAAGHPGAVARVVLVSPTVGPAVRRRLSWLRALPAPDGARVRPASRWRGRLLARLHGLLGDEPALRVLNVAEYACASLPRAVSTLRAAVLAPLEQVMPLVNVPALVVRADGDRLSSLAWARELARLAPYGELARLPGHGHDVFHRVPAAVADVAAPFLGLPA